MRDIADKTFTLRTARAMAELRASAHIVEVIRNQKVPKGDPLPVAKVAAIQAAKNTSQIIPYCHPLPVDFVGVEFQLKERSIEITTTVKAIYKTGVEMEALTAASVAALTIYDMVKMLDEEMEIVGVRLLEKTGGKSDFSGRRESLKAAVIVMSDTVAAGKKEDTSGKAIVERLKELGVEVVVYDVIPDDKQVIEDKIKHCADKLQMDLVVTTGGTGLSPRDCTPEAMEHLIEREIPGISEAARAYGQARTPYSMLSRGVSGMRGKSLIINLPGSRKGVNESLNAIFPGVLHVFATMTAGGHHHESTKHR